MGLLRPSLPWGFAAGSGSVFGPVAISDTVIQCRNKTGRQISQQDKQRGQQTRAAASKTSTCSFFTGFRSYVGMFFGSLLELLRPSLPWGCAARSSSISGSSSGIRHSARTRPAGKSASRISKRGQHTTAASKTSAYSFFTGFRSLKLC